MHLAQKIVDKNIQSKVSTQIMFILTKLRNDSVIFAPKEILKKMLNHCFVQHMNPDMGNIGAPVYYSEAMTMEPLLDQAQGAT